MSVHTRLVQRATVYQRGGMVEDDYGNLRPSTGAGKTYPALFQPQNAREVTLGGEVYTSDWTLFLPPEAKVDANDKVRREDGVLFEIIGAPMPRVDSLGHTQTLELALRHTA